MTGAGFCQTYQPAPFVERSPSLISPVESAQEQQGSPGVPSRDGDNLTEHIRQGDVRVGQDIFMVDVEQDREHQDRQGRGCRGVSMEMSTSVNYVYREVE